MSGVNKAIILGRLGKDPEVKETPSNKLCKFSVATSEKYKDKEGNSQENTEWHNIVVWGKLAEICGKYLAKGREVYIEGKIQTRSWDDDQGNKKYMTEIVASTVQFVGGKSESAAPQNHAPQFDDSDEIPF